VLRLPGDLFHFLARALLPPPPFAAQVGPVAIGPGGLDEDAPPARRSGADGEVFEVRRQLARGLGAVLWFLLQAAADDALELRWNMSGKLRRFVVEDGVAGFDGGSRGRMQSGP